MKKNILFIIITIMAMTILVGCNSDDTDSNTKDTDTESTNMDEDTEREMIEIGEVQVTEYFGLDLSRDGFRDALESRGYKEGENINIDYKNAQSDQTIGKNIAESFAADEKDLIHAVATPVAQAAYNATKDIPIAVTAITDPVDAGIVKSTEKSGTNVFGMSDMVPMEGQFELIKKFFPKAKTVGIVYSSSDANSTVKVKEAENIADEYDLEVIAQGATTTNDVGQTVESLLDKIDVLYVPTDSTVIPAMPIIIEKSLEKDIPIIPEEKGQIELGALATEGIDFYKLGYETGLMAADVLDGKSKPQDMAVEILEDRDIYVNKDALKALDIEVPKELKEKVKLLDTKTE